MAKTYHCEITVRGYELDSFDHVNHAVYVSYLEHARWEMLIQEGVTLETFKTWGKWPIISRIELQYMKPTFMGDVLRIHTTCSHHGKTHFMFEQQIFRERDQVQVLNAKILVVVVNEAGRPVAIPKELCVLWGETFPGTQTQL